MTRNSNPTRRLRQFRFALHHPLRYPVVAACLACLWPAPLMGGDLEQGAFDLPEYVVTATRTLRDIRELPTSLSVLRSEEFVRTQTDRLADVLRMVPGLSVVATGATGAQTAIFLRGASPHQTLFYVDGVRINDRTMQYPNLLGGADLGNMARIEVLRGPQSVLYGGSAMGGVIALESMTGTAKPRLSLRLQTGSLGTHSVGVDAKGVSGPVAWSGGASYFETDNHRPENSYWAKSGNTRLEWTVSEGLTAGLSARIFSSRYEEPGARGPFPFPGIVELEQHLLTAFLHFDSTGPWQSRLVLGQQEQEYSFTSSFGSTPVRHRREVLDWQLTYKQGEKLELTGGWLHEPIRQTTAGTTARERMQAGFISAVWQPEPDWTIIAGIREDQYRSWKGERTWRLGFSRTISGTQTKLRSTVGKGFAAPSLDDRFGNPAFFQPASPEILPERSLGWDAGIEQSLGAGRGTVSVTYFAQRFENLFGFDPVTFATTNVGRAQSRGLETEVTIRPAKEWLAKAAYTQIRATDRQTGERLARRPRHNFSATLLWAPDTAWDVGASLLVVADRYDSSFTGLVRLSDYQLLRFHASWNIGSQWTLRARVENALNQRFEEVSGYPALPRTYHFGAQFRF